MAFSLRRLRTHASIALANAIAIFITIYSGWTLSEATLAYLGEFVILALVVYVRVLAAKSLYGTEIGGWRLVGRKAIAIGITLPLYVVVVAVILLLVFGNTVPRGEEVFSNIRVPESTLRSLALCWAGFLVPHVFGLVEHLREGAYDELISDGRVMSPMWRYPPLLLAGIGIAGEQRDGAMIVPWFFVGTLALFAIVDAATYIYEQDAVSTAARRARALAARSLRA